MEREPKLHELLAVEPDAEGAFKSIVEETRNTFAKKPEHFLGYAKTLKMHEDERRHEEEGAGETKEMVDTVPSKLKYASQSAIRYFDILLQKESTNQNARSDLVVDDVTIGEKLPATFLLGLESRLKLIKAYFEEIPTLQPGVKWIPDPEAGDGVFKAEEPELRQKTEKSFRYKVLYEATKEHPAQIEKWAENVIVGTFITNKWTGMISPAKKSEYLGRLDKLIQAVKKARQRANSEPVVQRTIGKELMEYILKG